MKWNSALVSYEILDSTSTANSSHKKSLQKVRATFSDGESRVFSCLIGADGIRSKLRELLLGDPINYLGVMSIVGIAPTGGHPFLQSRVIQILDGTQRVFIKPFDDDTCMWQLTYPSNTPDSEARTQEWALEEARKRCTGWMDPVPTLLAQTPAGKIRYAALYDRQPISKTTKVPNIPIVLLGDAAHPMSPFKGQGANQALEDARDIAALLLEAISKNSNSFDAVFRKFIGMMAHRSVPRVLKSRSHVAFYHQPSCLVEETLFRYNNVQDVEKMHQTIANVSTSHGSQTQAAPPESSKE